MVLDHAKEFILAGQQDMYRRSEEELQREEIKYSIDEVTVMIDNLASYMQDVAVGKHPEMGVGKLHYTPMGNTLLICPWNFPLNLCVVPLAGAISAGCTAIVKPSEVSPAVAAMLAKLIPMYLDDSCYKVVLGAVKETTELLQHKFDLIFFTGAPVIGKIVAMAAAKTLTPCVLELGGKNPVIVDNTVDLDKVADQLVAGRYTINCGQNCTSPDFVIINRNQQDSLIAALKKSMRKIIGDEPSKSKVYSGVVNKRHFDRLMDIVKNTPRENLAAGGDCNERELYIEPVVIKDCNRDSYSMQQEMFGPILNIFPVDDVEKEAIEIVQSYPKPLISFLFSNNEKFRNEVVNRTNSGGLTINSVTDHFVFPGFPFGGVGHSGIGRYHGKYSFLAFSHEKPVLTAKL